MFQHTCEKGKVLFVPPGNNTIAVNKYYYYKSKYGEGD